MSVTLVPMVPPVAALPMDRLLPNLGQAPAPQLYGSSAFSQLLLDGIDKVSVNLTNADNLVRSFALDDSIPVHQVTFALEQARLSLELMLQVRNRFVEGYQQLMNMQL